MNSTSLAGRTVVLTRPLQQSIQLERELIALGAHVVQMPLIATALPLDKGEALNTSLANLQQYDWLVVTSANGAAQVAGALSQMSVRPKLAANGSKGFRRGLTWATCSRAAELGPQLGL